MEKDKLSTDETTLLVDLSEATQAVKENRFDDALNLFEIILKDHPDHIDSLYLAAVSARYLRKYEDSRSYIESLLTNAPNMGRAYQELGHLNKAINSIDDAIGNYMQACELIGGAGHWVQQEKPEEVAKLLLNFLSKL